MSDRFRLTSFVGALILVAVGPTVCSADEPTVRSVAPGEEVRLAALGSMKADCTANPPPNVRVSGRISSGGVRVLQAKMKTKRFPNCPDAELPVKVVLYKANAQSSGSDTVRLEITEHSGKVRDQMYDVRIEEKPSP